MRSKEFKTSRFILMLILSDSCVLQVETWQALRLVATPVHSIKDCPLKPEVIAKLLRCVGATVGVVCR